MNVRITRIHPDAILPVYQTLGSAGFDLASCADVTVEPHRHFLVPTGLVIATPSGHVLLLTARSSLFLKKGLLLGNSVGTIDSDYCGPTDELKIIVWNPGDTPVTIAKGERLVNGLIIPIVRANLVEGEADAPSRGGFGSTGGYSG